VVDVCEIGRNLDPCMSLDKKRSDRCGERNSRTCNGSHYREKSRIRFKSRISEPRSRKMRRSSGQFTHEFISDRGWREDELFRKWPSREKQVSLDMYNCL